jgi:hypothetical protein
MQQLSPIPNSFATAATLWPDKTRFTAWLLNSGVNLRRACFSLDLI